MGMKFLNKKGWHTGSLRNIENVWKAEQKHGAEQKKLEELRKQIQEERERAEFRQLQEQAGLVPRQERLEFLYESGLAVGKGSSSSDVVFDSLGPSLPLSDTTAIPPPPPPSSSTATQQPLVPGALFEEKPQSANDAWRKLHSDPLLLIRQREQESLARVKNNPVQMAIIRNEIEAKKSKEKVSKSKEHREKKHKKKKAKHHKYSSEEEEQINNRDGMRSSKGDDLSEKMDYVSRKDHQKKYRNGSSPSVEEEERSTYSRGGGKTSKGDKMDHASEREERDTQRKNHRRYRDSSVEEEERPKYTRGNGKSSSRDMRLDKIDYGYEREGENRDGLKRNSKYDDDEKLNKRTTTKTTTTKMDYQSDERRREKDERHSHRHASDSIQSVHHRRPNRHVASTSKLSAEERAAKLKEMQMDAEVHEESRWKRIKKADEIDSIQEAAATMRNATNSSKNFLDAAKRSVYGAEKGGSATIEESVRRRTHYLQSKSDVGQGNAFRR